MKAEELKAKVTKVKIFEFRVSNPYGSVATGACGCWKEKFDDSVLPSTQEQEKEMNKFLKGKTIKNVVVNTYDIHQHNNGGCDTIIVRYTYFYEE